MAKTCGFRRPQKFKSVKLKKSKEGMEVMKWTKKGKLWHVGETASLKVDLYVDTDETDDGEVDRFSLEMQPDIFCLRPGFCLPLESTNFVDAKLEVRERIINRLEELVKQAKGGKP